MQEINIEILEKIKKEANEIFKKDIIYHLKKINCLGVQQFDHVKTWKDKNQGKNIYKLFDIIDKYISIKDVPYTNVCEIFVKVIINHIEKNKKINEMIENKEYCKLTEYMYCNMKKNCFDGKPDFIHWNIREKPGERFFEKEELKKEYFNEESIKNDKTKFYKTHIFDKKESYNIENKSNKIKSLITSEIIKPIENFINEKENGLFLCTAPTGAGKSYQITKFIINQMIKNPKQKIIFITDRKENLKIPFQNLINQIENLKELEYNDKNFLKSQVVLIESQEDSLSSISKEDILNVLENVKFLILNKNVNTPILNKKSLDERIKSIQKNIDNFNITKKTLTETNLSKDIIKTIEKNISDEKNNILKSLSIILRDLSKIKLIEELTINSKDTLYNLFPSDAIYDHQVSFLTTAKILLPIGGVRHKAFNLETLKDTIIVIDEISVQKKVLESNFLKVAAYNSNKHLAKILTIKNIDITNTSIFKIIENEIKELKVILISDSFNNLHPERRFSYCKDKDDKKERASIFYDGKFSSKINLESKFLSFNSSFEEKINKIIEKEANKINKDSKFIDYLKDIEFFIDNIFCSKIIQMAQILEDDLNDFSIEQAMKEIFSLLNIETENDEIEKAGSLFNRTMNNLRVSRQKSNIKTIDNISGYKNNIRITKFTDDGLSKSFVNFETHNIKYNANIFLLSLCKKNKIVGLSATALAETNVNNFDLNFLEDNLDNYMTYKEKEIEKIKKELSYKDDVDKINYDIRPIENIGNGALFEYLNLKEVISGDKQYINFLEEPFNYLEKSMDLFLEKKHSRYMVAFASRKYHKYVKCLNEFYKLKKLKNVKIFGMDANDIRKKEIFKEIKNYLRQDIKNKVIVLTTYQTASSGLNLQRELNIFEKESFICLNDKYNNSHVDIDTIYLDNPTQVFINGLYEEEGVNEKKALTMIQLEIITRLKELLAAGTISPEQYEKSYIKMSKAKCKNSKAIKNLQNDIYNYTFDKNQNLMAELRQTIGRMLRTNNRCKETNIYISRKFIEELNEYDENEKIELETKEMSMIIDMLNKERIYPKNVYYKNAAEKASNLSAAYIKNILRYINMPLSNEDFKRKSQIKNIEEWENLRKYVLNNGVYLNEEQLKNSPKLKRLTFKVEENYKFKANGSPDDISSFTYGDGKEVNEKLISLDLINNNIELRNHFKENGYVTKFNKKFNYALSPVLVNDIYKGAIGEEIFRFISKKYNIKTESLPLEKYEKADFLIKDRNIGIDSKHWINRHQTEEEKEAFFFKAKKKLEVFDKLVYVNSFSHQSDILYTDENGFETSRKNAKILIIQGIISSETGEELENTPLNIMELKKWINS